MVKVLLVNDDGVHAPGINELFKKLKTIADVTVVAPLQERSTTGHTLSLDHPLRVQKVSDRIFGCTGFPADCSLMGVSEILGNARPDVVISGINRGANLGQDIYYSGTVAAAREAIFHNVPALSISLTTIDSSINSHYESASEVAKIFVETRAFENLAPMELININVPNLPWPDIKGSSFGGLGFRNYRENVGERTDFRNRKYFWIGGNYQGHEGKVDTDCQIIDEEKISLTLINLLQGVAEENGKWTSFLNALNH